MTGPAKHTRGQILALFALALLPIMAMVGLSIDGGNIYLQRRTAQNGADAAALAGVYALSSVSAGTSDTTIGEAISCLVNQNQFGTTPSGSAIFVAANGNALSPSVSINLASSCAVPSTATTVPSNASGVHVTSTIGPFNTYILGMIGLTSTTVNGQATAVGTAMTSEDIGATGSDFLALCGGYMVVESTDATEDIFQTVTPPVVNYSTYSGTEYWLESQEMDYTQNANLPDPPYPDCPDANGTGFWGAINPSTDIVSIPALVPTQHGNVNEVSRIQALCSATSQGDPTTSPAGTCYLPIPISNDTGNDASHADIVTFACFQMMYVNSGNNIWAGILATGFSVCPKVPGSTYGGDGQITA